MDIKNKRLEIQKLQLELNIKKLEARLLEIEDEKEVILKSIKEQKENIKKIGG